MLKQLIERTDTNEWLGQSEDGVVFWTKEATEALQFEGGQAAADLYESLIESGRLTREVGCEITDHLFVDESGDPASEEVISNNISEEEDVDFEEVKSDEVKEEEEEEEVIPEGTHLYDKRWASGTYPGATLTANLDVAREAASQQVVDGNIDFHITKEEGGVLKQSVYFNPKK